MNIEQVKSNLLKTMDSIDKDKLNLSELRLYAETLKIISEIQTKNYMDTLVDTISSAGFGTSYRPPVIADMK